jgi:adenine-specific DNA-methyltransferase
MNQYANVHDYLLFYTKSSNYLWNQPTRQPTQEWIDREYPKFDERGRYKLVPVHAPGTRRGETGQPWKGMNPPPGKHWQYVPSKLDELDRDGFIHWSKTGNPRRKVYLTDDKAIPYSDNWDCFRDAHHQSVQITGYPTEKNLAMLRMIVGASSNPGDLVVDPFCGSGTTLHAANDLGRRWIGFDESFVATAAALTRLKHGMRPMGDYVPRKPWNEPQGVLVDLLEAKQQRAPESVAADFRFLVDSELLGGFGEEIQRFSQI